MLQRIKAFLAPCRLPSANTRVSDCAQYRPISGQTHRERPLGVRVAQLAWLTLRLSCGHTCATKPAATPAVLAAVVATDPATDTPADTVPTCGSFESHFVQMFEATATDTALNDNLENMLHVTHWSNLYRLQMKETGARFPRTKKKTAIKGCMQKGVKR